MRCWTVEGLGAPPILRDTDMPDPGAGEVRIAVVSAGLNFADMLMLDGTYQVRPPLPFVPGMEVAGVVEALGPDTPGPAVGSPVLAVCGHGALAERVCLPASRLIPIPPGMGFDVAAALPIVYGTAHLGLTYKARLQPGETLFVTGAAGGVGLAAVEVGKRLGARVIASARGRERLALARDAGAEVLIDSDDPGLKDRLRAEGGIDVLFDAVGGPAFDAALRATRPDGRLVAIGFASGQVPQVPANILLVKNLTVIGFWFGGYQTQAPDQVTASLAEVLRWWTDGAVRPHVGQVRPFERFPEGLALLRDRKAQGKVVIRVAQVA
ncbi:MAG: zinc-binding dehydrogenase [Rhodobacterales bacterium 32-66-7]|nr:MAG: zinc-binding dehydrogenase [Rhodobacterales bacterium 32-66-7]